MWERMGHSWLQGKLAADLVDDVVSRFLFGLDIYLAGLDADFVGQTVIGLGAVHEVGDVILLAGIFHIDFRCQRRAAAMGGLAGLGGGFCCLIRFGSFACGLFCSRSVCHNSGLFLRHEFNHLSQMICAAHSAR